MAWVHFTQSALQAAARSHGAVASSDVAESLAQCADSSRNSAQGIKGDCLQVDLAQLCHEWCLQGGQASQLQAAY